MLTQQPNLPGLTGRGRPPSGLSRSERTRLNQAERRRKMERGSLSVEVDSELLAAFKSLASNRKLPLRHAVEGALRQWIGGPSTATIHGEA
jgi:hypothetical protein